MFFFLEPRFSAIPESYQKCELEFAHVFTFWCVLKMLIFRVLGDLELLSFFTVVAVSSGRP